MASKLSTSTTREGREMDERGMLSFFAAPCVFRTRGKGNPSNLRTPQSPVAKSSGRRVRVRTYPELQELFFVEIGTGSDLHGQDATKAAVRACRDAVAFNSLPALRRLLPNGDLSSMVVRVTLGVPEEYVENIDEVPVRAVFPYGEVLIRIQRGGLLISAGIFLPEQGDREGDDSILIVNAAVEVGA